MTPNFLRLAVLLHFIGKPRPSIPRLKFKLIVLDRDLAWDTWLDAASPYGQIINGFQLIEGWHIRYLLCLILGSILLSACVVAVSTAIQGNFEAGLTAGSYALAITTLGLAVLTFLSAIF